MRLNLAAGADSVLKTVLFSSLAFIWFAAAEEVMFRGYALQTMTRAGYAWIGILLTSLAFAVAHLGNPNVSPFFTFTNTALAGVWLGLAYWKTRSLWFPLGLHWAWNWTMGSLVGLPVSGITEIAPAPLFQTTLHGPQWLTGGAYGVEGGVACTVAIVLSTLFIWRARIVKASDEMLAFDESRRLR
jgi:membrane protease YdiL (CAAX protease family)